MNKRQVLAATVAVPIIAFVILLPPHRVTGSVEARPKQASQVVSLSMGKTWVLRPHGSAQTVTLDIEAAVFTAVSRRDYELMLWPWLGSLFSVLALTLGALFFLRSPAPEPVDRMESAPAPQAVGLAKPGTATWEQVMPAARDPIEEQTRRQRKTTRTIIDN